MAASLILRPVAVVIGVGQNRPDEDYPARVVEHRDEPVVVAADVKHGESSDCLGRRVHLLHVQKPCPSRALCAPIPGVECLFGIGMRGGELAQPLPAEDVHPTMFSKREPQVKSARAPIGPISTGPRDVYRWITTRSSNSITCYRSTPWL